MKSVFAQLYIFFEKLREEFGNLAADSEARHDEGRYAVDEAQIPESLKTNELWNAILGIAGGDMQKAVQLMKNPEELQTHPEMIRMFGEEGGAEDTETSDGDEEESGDDDDSSGEDEEEGGKKEAK